MTEAEATARAKAYAGFDDYDVDFASLIPKARLRPGTDGLVWHVLVTRVVEIDGTDMIFTSSVFVEDETGEIWEFP